MSKIMFSTAFSNIFKYVTENLFFWKWGNCFPVCCTVRYLKTFFLLFQSLAVLIHYYDDLILESRLFQSTVQPLIIFMERLRGFKNSYIGFPKEINQYGLLQPPWGLSITIQSDIIPVDRWRRSVTGSWLLEFGAFWLKLPLLSADQNCL